MPKRSNLRRVLVISACVGQACLGVEQPSTQKTPERRGIVRPGPPEAIDKATTRGIFVGVNFFYNDESPREEFTHIPFAVDDAVDLAYYFSVQAKLIDPKNIALLIEGEPKKATTQEHKKALTEDYGVKVQCPNSQKGEVQETTSKETRFGCVSKPTKENILSAFKEAASPSLLIASFATHGFVEKDRQLLLASDSKRSSIQTTAIGLTDLSKVMEAKRSLLLFDSCRSYLLPARTLGPDSQSTVGKDFEALLRRSQGRAIFIAAKYGGNAFDDIERKNGIFTGALLETLTESKEGVESLVRLKTLGLTVDEEVCRRTRDLHFQIQPCGISFNVPPDMENFPLPKARFDRLVPIVLVLPSGCAIEFASIPAGEFLMGEPGMRTDTGPVRTVRITRPFQLSKYEVTQEVWQAVMGSNPSWFKSPVRPVESVSTEQIDLFFEKLNQLDSKYEYSLPTEAEWERGQDGPGSASGSCWHRLVQGRLKRRDSSRRHAACERIRRIRHGRQRLGSGCGLLQLQLLLDAAALRCESPQQPLPQPQARLERRQLLHSRFLLRADVPLSLEQEVPTCEQCRIPHLAKAQRRIGDLEIRLGGADKRRTFWSEPSSGFGPGLRRAPAQTRPRFRRWQSAPVRVFRPEARALESAEARFKMGYCRPGTRPNDHRKASSLPSALLNKSPCTR